MEASSRSAGAQLQRLCVTLYFRRSLARPWAGRGWTREAATPEGIALTGRRRARHRCRPRGRPPPTGATGPAPSRSGDPLVAVAAPEPVVVAPRSTTPMCGPPAGVGTQARAARRTPVARADPMISTSSTAVKAAPPRRSNKTAHLDEVVGAVRRLRAGETLLPLDEVIELLRFAGRRREQEHADARRSPSSLPRTRGPASARRHSTARRSPNASTYPSVRSATTPPTSSPPRRGAHRDLHARRQGGRQARAGAPRPAATLTRWRHHPLGRDRPRALGRHTTRSSGQWRRRECPSSRNPAVSRCCCVSSISSASESAGIVEASALADRRRGGHSGSG